jgi:hypothetical protein
VGDELFHADRWTDRYDGPVAAFPSLAKTTETGTSREEIASSIS